MLNMLVAEIVGHQCLSSIPGIGGNDRVCNVKFRNLILIPVQAVPCHYGPSLVDFDGDVNRRRGNVE